MLQLRALSPAPKVVPFEDLIMKVPVVLFGLLVAVVSGLRSLAEPDDFDLAHLICRNEPISLDRISQARAVLELASDLDSCQLYRDSFNELSSILAIVSSGQICNLELVDRIRRYHERFIWAPDARPPGKSPAASRHFFISLCFQVSAECKMTLINNLECDTRGVLAESDYDIIKSLESHGATLMDSESEIADFDDIILFDEFAENSAMEEQFAATKILVKIKTNAFLKELLRKCRTKFRSARSSSCP